MADGIIRLDEGWRLDEGHHFDEPPNVPPPALPPVLSQQKKGKSMDFVPRKRDVRYKWFGKMSDNIIAEAVKFGAPPADATAVKNAADDAVGKMEATDAAQSALDGARLIEKNAVAAALAFIRAKVRNFKTLPLWAASGSEAVLEVKGNEPAFDASSYKPVLDLSIEAGKIRVDFTMGGVDAMAVYCRLRGTLVWRRIGIDTEAPYFDTAPLAQPGVAEVREYMARGMVSDEEVGQDSDIVSIAFGG